MITLRGETGKTIQYSTGKVIYECANDSYIVEMPIVVCDNKKDAERIQKEISALIANLSKELSKEKLV